MQSSSVVVDEIGINQDIFHRLSVVDAGSFDVADRRIDFSGDRCFNFGSAYTTAMPGSTITNKITCAIETDRPCHELQS
jgi:hypothetical protein